MIQFDFWYLITSWWGPVLSFEIETRNWMGLAFHPSGIGTCPLCSLSRIFMKFLWFSVLGSSEQTSFAGRQEKKRLVVNNLDFNHGEDATSKDEGLTTILVVDDKSDTLISERMIMTMMPMMPLLLCFYLNSSSWSDIGHLTSWQNLKILGAVTLQHLHIQSPQESWTVKKNQNKYYLLYILSPTNTSHISSQWGLVSNCACNKPKPKICGGNYGWKGKVWAVAPSTGGPHAREHALCRTSCTSCFRLFRNHIWRTTLSDQSHPQRWRHCREDETRSPLQTGHHRPLPCSKALDLPTKQVFGQQPLGQNLNRHPSILDYWMLALGQRTKKKGRTQIHKTSWYPNPVCWKGLVTKKYLGT